MWSILQKLVLPQLSKHLTLVLGIGCLLLGLYGWYTHTAYENMYKLYNEECIARELLETQYVLEQDKFKTTITQQNTQIEQYKINLEQFEQTVHTKEKELAETRYKLQEQVNLELAKDPSCENQLTIVNRILYEFSKEN